MSFLLFSKLWDFLNDVFYFISFARDRITIIKLISLNFPLSALITVLNIMPQTIPSAIE